MIDTLCINSVAINYGSRQSQAAAVLASAGLAELRKRDAAPVAQTNAPLPADEAIEPAESFAFSADAVGQFDSAMSDVDRILSRLPAIKDPDEEDPKSLDQKDVHS